ncbi:MAG: hypothetical protein ACHQ4H_12370 [Ktedonobacterales bacterium]
MPDDISYHSALIVHPDEPRVLLLPDGDGRWRLPRIVGDEPPQVTASLRDTLGLEATVLARVDEPPDAAGQPGHVATDEEQPAASVFAVEPLGHAWQPPAGARWCARDELRDLAVVVPAHAEVAAGWLREQREGVPPLRAPWARPGWRDEALAWVHAECARQGRPVTGASEQLRLEAWSTVYRVPVGGATLYFKAAALVHAYEAELTRLLDERVGPRVPHIVALDAARGWLLLEDAGTEVRERVLAEHGAGLMAAYLPEFARLQAAMGSDVAALLAAGCPDRRLAMLPAQFAALAADRELLLAGAPDGMPEAEYARLHALAPEVSAICVQLAAYGIPETVHHDDLGPGNVLRGPHGFVFLDWAESAVTHPFCSLMIVLRWAKLVVDCDDAALDSLRAAYLAEWTRYGTRAELREAAALAHRLGYLCRALTYAELVRGLEPRARVEFAGAPAYWLRLFLRDAEVGDDPPDVG